MVDRDGVDAHPVSPSQISLALTDSMRVLLERWMAVHQPFVDAWIRRCQAQGDVPLPLALTAASTLLSIPALRFFKHTKRPLYMWSQIDAHEVLFEHIADLGPVEPDFLEMVRDFANDLGQLSIIPPRDHAKLQREWGMWSARLLAAQAGTSAEDRAAC